MRYTQNSELLFQKISVPLDSSPSISGIFGRAQRDAIDNQRKGPLPLGHSGHVVNFKMARASAGHVHFNLEKVRLSGTLLSNLFRKEHI